MDSWCNLNCLAPVPYCPGDICECWQVRYYIRYNNTISDDDDDNDDDDNDDDDDDDDNDNDDDDDDNEDDDDNHDNDYSWI